VLREEISAEDLRTIIRAVKQKATKGDLKAWVQTDLVADISSALTGPIGAASLDLVESMNQAPPDSRQALFQILAALTADPGPGAADAPRFRALLSFSADLLQLMLDDADLVPIVRKLAPLFDPQNGAVEGAGWVVLRSLPSDPNQVLLQLGKNLLRADINGLYPAYRLGEILNEIHRARAGETGVYGSDLNEADMQAIAAGLGQFLADPMRGAVRLVDIVQNRNLPQ
jgi:hypothetical protein